MAGVTYWFNCSSAIDYGNFGRMLIKFI